MSIVAGFMQACQEAGLSAVETRGRLKRACELSPEFAEELRKAAVETGIPPLAATPSPVTAPSPSPTPDNGRQLLEAALPSLALGTLGAGYGAIQAPGKSRLRGAIIGALGGAGAGAAFSGANAILDSQHGKHLTSPGVNSALLLGGAGLGMHGGVTAGRALAGRLGLGDPRDKVNDDLSEIDVLHTGHKWLPTGLKDYFHSKAAAEPATGPAVPNQFAGASHPMPNLAAPGGAPKLPQLSQPTPSPAAQPPAAPALPKPNLGVGKPPVAQSFSPPPGPAPINNPDDLAKLRNMAAQGMGGSPLPGGPPQAHVTNSPSNVQAPHSFVTRMTGNTQVDPRTQNETSVPGNNTSVGDAVRAVARTGSAPLTILPALGMDAYEGIRGTAPAKGNSLGLNWSGAVLNDLAAAPNELLGTHMGTNATPGAADGSVYAGPGQGRSLFVDQTNPITGQRSPSMLSVFGDRANRESMRPDAEGGGFVSRSLNAGIGAGSNLARSVLPLVVGAKIPGVNQIPGIDKVPSWAGGLAAGGAGMSTGLNGLNEFTSPGGDASRQQAWTPDNLQKATVGLAEDPNFLSQMGAKQPGHSSFEMDAQMHGMSPMDRSMTQNALGMSHGGKPSAVPPQQSPLHDSALRQVADDPNIPPEQKQQIAESAIKPNLIDKYKTPEAIADFARRGTEGQLNPNEQAEGFDNFAKQVAPDVDAVKDPGMVQQLLAGWEEMGKTPGMQAMFAAGLGVGAIGLIHALSGGDMMSWVLAAAGLGAAGYAGASTGAFGSTAKGWADQAGSAVGGLLGGDSSKSELGQPPAGMQADPNIDMAKSIVSTYKQNPQAALTQAKQFAQTADPKLISQINDLRGYLTSKMPFARSGALARLAKYGLDEEGANTLMQIWDQVQPAQQNHAAMLPATNLDGIHMLQGQPNVNGNIPAQFA